MSDETETAEGLDWREQTVLVPDPWGTLAACALGDLLDRLEAGESFEEAVTSTGIDMGPVTADFVARVRRLNDSGDAAAYWDRYWHDAVISLNEFPDDPAFPKVALRLGELIQWITSGHEPKGTVTFADGATITSAELAGWIAWWAARAELGLADSVGGAEFGAALHRKLHEASGGAVLAQLYFTWEELELLAGLVEGRIGLVAVADPEWGNLNTMRTALREAQYGLRR